jgi:hypothetical protein
VSEPTQELADFEYVPKPDVLEAFSYEVIDSGDDFVEVPFLVAVAPSVEGAAVEASITETKAQGAGITLKIIGTGIGGSAKVTIKSTREIKADPGEAIGLVFVLPVHWEKRARPSNLDNWHTHVEVGNDGRSATPVKQVNDSSFAGLGHLLDKNRWDMRRAGAEPGTISEARTVEAEANFSVGFKNALAGIEAELTVALETSVEVSLSATLPTGHNYEASWWSDPSAAKVQLV